MFAIIETVVSQIFLSIIFLKDPLATMKKMQNLLSVIIVLIVISLITMVLGFALGFGFNKSVFKSLFLTFSYKFYNFINFIFKEEPCLQV